MAEDPLARWFPGHQTHTLIIDSGLWVVYLIGLFDSRQLRNCRATKSFSDADFMLLVRIVRRFSRILATPQIVTEVSNHATKLPDPVRAQFMSFFRLMILKTVHEREVSSKAAVEDPAFSRIGITDAAIARVAALDTTVLSIDVALVDTIQRRGGDAINYNHLREALVLG